MYNAISNGRGQAGIWRTLTDAEWYYIFNTRDLAQQKRAKATVCGVHGYVLLPDGQGSDAEYLDFEWEEISESGFSPSIQQLARYSGRSVRLVRLCSE